MRIPMFLQDSLNIMFGHVKYLPMIPSTVSTDESSVGHIEMAWFVYLAIYAKLVEVVFKQRIKEFGLVTCLALDAHFGLALG